VLDGEHGPRRGSTLVVDGSRIASVGTDLVRTESEDLVIDLGGRTLMPGMVMGHFHSTYHELGSVPAPFGLEEPPALQAVRAVTNLERVLMRGFTSVVSAGAPFGIDAAMRRAIGEGAIVGPRLVPGSRDLSTTGHANDAAPWYWRVAEPGALHLCDGPDEFRRAVRQEIKEGARIIKMFVTGGHGTTGPAERIEMTRAELEAAIEAAHLRGALVRGHIANRDAILMALELGIDVIDHGDGMDDRCIEALVERAIPVVPSVFFVFSLWDSLKDQGHVFVRTMRADLDAAFEVVPKANAAGVKLVIGDDYGAAGFPHGRYAEELAFYVDVVGIPALDVIRWATIHGAHLMGRSDELGALRPGMLADILVVDGDPSADIAVLQKPERLMAIMKDGRFVKDDLSRAAAPA
jgi:imidazolonepropionase-like amidohydrolase